MTGGRFLPDPARIRGGKQTGGGTSPPVVIDTNLIRASVSDALFSTSDGVKVAGDWWTTPISPNATFSPYPWGPNMPPFVFADKSYSIIVDNSMPLINVYAIYSWTDRLGPNGNGNGVWLEQVRLPNEFVVPHNPNNPINAPVTVFNRDDNTFKQFNACERAAGGGNMVGYRGNGAHAGSGLSCASITYEELIGGSIEHAIALQICHWLFTSPLRGGKTYPATRVDANWNNYTQGNGFYPGTVSGTQGSNVVIGVGTTFQTNFAVGNIITLGTEHYSVASIASQTSLTIGQTLYRDFTAEKYYKDYYGPGYYNGKNPDVEVGSLLAIPPNVTAASIGVTNPYVRTIFNALKKYGAYITDDTQSVKRWSMGVDDKVDALGIFGDSVISSTNQSVQLSACIAALRVVKPNQTALAPRGINALTDVPNCVALVEAHNVNNTEVSGRTTVARNVINTAKNLVVPTFNSEVGPRGPLVITDEVLNRKVWNLPASQSSGTVAALGVQGLFDTSKSYVVGMLYRPMSSDAVSMLCRLDKPVGSAGGIVSNILWYNGVTYGQNSTGYGDPYAEYPQWKTFWWLYKAGDGTGTGLSSRCFLCFDGEIFRTIGINVIAPLETDQSSINFSWASNSNDYNLPSGSDFTTLIIGNKTWNNFDGSDELWAKGTTRLSRVVAYNGWDDIPPSEWMDRVQALDKILRAG
jgi:hypothetical protein